MPRSLPIPKNSPKKPQKKYSCFWLAHLRDSGSCEQAESLVYKSLGQRPRSIANPFAGCRPALFHVFGDIDCLSVVA